MTNHLTSKMTVMNYQDVKYLVRDKVMIRSSITVVHSMDCLVWQTARRSLESLIDDSVQDSFQGHKTLVDILVKRHKLI